MQNGRPMYHDQGGDTSEGSGVFNNGSHCYNNVQMVIIISIPNMPHIYRIPKKVTEINTKKGYFPTRNSANPYASNARLKSASSIEVGCCDFQGHIERRGLWL